MSTNAELAKALKVIAILEQRISGLERDDDLLSRLLTSKARGAISAWRSRDKADQREVIDTLDEERERIWRSLIERDDTAYQQKRTYHYEDAISLLRVLTDEEA